MRPKPITSLARAAHTFKPVRRHPPEVIHFHVEHKGGASCARCGRLWRSGSAYDKHRESVRNGDCAAISDDELRTRGFTTNKLDIWSHKSLQFAKR
jgi:hypothetical protein